MTIKFIFAQNLIKRYFLYLLIMFSYKLAFAQPANDNPCNAITLPLSAATVFDNVCTNGLQYTITGATKTSGLSDCGLTGVSVNSDVWFKVVTPTTGRAIIHLYDVSVSGMALQVYEGFSSCSLTTGSSISCSFSTQNTSTTPGSDIYIRITAPVSNFSFKLCAKVGNPIPGGIFNSRYIGINNINPITHLDVNGDVLIRRDLYIKGKSSQLGNAQIEGFTTLGKTSDDAPSIKMKKLVIPVGPAVDALGSYPMGSDITDAKVLGVQIFITYAVPWKIPPSYRDAAGYEFNYQVQANNIVIINKSGNSANIGNKPFTVLITYEE